jgi:hypothetical protein
MQRVALCLLVVACGERADEHASARATAGSAAEATDPKRSAATTEPTKLRLVTCGPAPEVPLMRAGDPDVPGTVYGYHQGAPPDTPYTRQPFGLPQPPLAKPYIFATPSSDRYEIAKALNAALAPHEDKLLACYAEALADQSASQHEMNVEWRGRKVEVTLGDDIRNPRLDAASTECVAKVLRPIKLPPKVQRGVDDAIVWLHASRLQAVKQPPKKVRAKHGEFKFSRAGFEHGGHGTRDQRNGWTGYRGSGTLTMAPRTLHSR